MPATITLMDRVKSELILKGLGRDPRTGGPNGLYPIYREVEAAIAPGEGPGTEKHDDLVLTLFIAPGIPTAVVEADYFREDSVDFWIRARNAPLAVEFEKNLRAAFHGKQNWMMGPINGDNGERMIETRMFTDLRPLERTKQAFTFTTQYIFQHYIPPLTV